MESLLLLLSALDVDGDELPRQQLAFAMSPVPDELAGLNDVGLQRMSRPGKVESSELESLKLSHSKQTSNEMHSIHFQTHSITDIHTN